ncbi:Conserved_hypothetical protein [Hexamita inflata]|uniref:Uncharacterized protein n=1 Tax=Hexamita inflata TaxID=28002 RepID=A0AA86TS50_9EUKA|nr:Conserved hypothetical protein [Hexamita inflata]
MHQSQITTEEVQPYYLISAYSLLTTNVPQLRSLIAHLQAEFPQSIISVSQQLNALLTQDVMFDVPQFPNLKGIIQSQADLLFCLAMSGPLTTQKFTLMKLTSGLLNLVDQKFCYSSSLDPAGSPFPFKQQPQNVITENGGSFCFYLRFACDTTSLSFLSEQELQKITKNRAERWQELSEYQSLTLNSFDSNQGFVFLGFGTSLIQFETALRKAFGFSDEFSDQYILDYCPLQTQGYYYCLPLSEMKSFSTLPHTQPKLAEKKPKWPKREGDEEEEKIEDEPEEKPEEHLENEHPEENGEENEEIPENEQNEEQIIEENEEQNEPEPLNQEKELEENEVQKDESQELKEEMSQEPKEGEEVQEIEPDVEV